MAWSVKQGNGIYLPDIDWHLDARYPAKRSFVSHAHFDHMAKHRQVLCSPATAQLFQERMGGERDWLIHPFGEAFSLQPGVTATLLPAGHIIGSAMLHLTGKAGETLLYTGDFKLSQGRSAETCQPLAAETLIMETTYGLPRYVFPASEEVMADMVRFARETLANGQTPVLFGYSLGKCQEILSALAEAKLPVMLHPQALKMTETCRALGWDFPHYQAFDPSSHQDHVIISPPFPKSHPWIKALRNPQTAMVTGWALDSSAHYRYQCDKTFPLSDHADYLDLLSFVAQVRPKVVYTVHGYAEEFAATLREQGIEAWALGKENQMGLSLSIDPPSPPAQPTKSAAEPSNAPNDSILALAQLCQSIDTTDNLERQEAILSKFFQELSPEDIQRAVALLVPVQSFARKNKADPLDWNFLKAAFFAATGKREADFKTAYQTIRDNFKVIQTLRQESEFPPSTRSLLDWQRFLQNLSATPQPIFKSSLLCEELKKLSPTETVVLMKRLREIPLASISIDSLLNALASRFQTEPAAIKHAHFRLQSLVDLVPLFASDKKADIEYTPFVPLPIIKGEIVTEIPETLSFLDESLWVENHYNGIPCQIHKVGDRCELFDDRGGNICHTYPELREAGSSIPENFVGNGIILPWNDERPLLFADLERRLTRKGQDLFLGEEVPVILYLDDALWYEGQDLISRTLETRRRFLDNISVNPRIRIAPVNTFAKLGGLASAVSLAQSQGFHGISYRDPHTPYF